MRQTPVLRDTARWGSRGRLAVLALASGLTLGALGRTLSVASAFPYLALLSALGTVLLAACTAQLARDDLSSNPEARPGRYVRVAVRDTGHGMSEDVLARAVEPFFSTKEVGQGTGLGLSVVRRLTADMNGSIRVESQPGRGTTFTIELPACTPS